MTESHNQPSQLFMWLSPAFPVSAFAYSNGLEAAVDRGWVTNGDELKAWLTDITQFGSIKTDLVLLALVHRAETDAELDDRILLAAALQPCSERHYEATTQGRGFRDGYLAGWKLAGSSSAWQREDLTFAAAVGLAAKEHGLALGVTLEAFACAAHSNLTSAAMRLGILGQFEAQKVLGAVMPVTRAVCQTAATARESDLGTATFVADIACMYHETQQPRIFRT